MALPFALVHLNVLLCAADWHLLSKRWEPTTPLSALLHLCALLYDAD